MFPKPVGKAVIIANDFAFNSQMELEVCNQLFCLLPPAKRQRNGGEDGYDQSSSESTMTRSVCIFFFTAETRGTCAGLLRTTPRPAFTCRGNKDHGEKKKKINHVFIKPLAFLFLFFLPAYMLNVLHASHKGQKKNMAIYFWGISFFPVIFKCDVQK